jgi:SAM-dependent methyltransferase
MRRPELFCSRPRPKESTAVRFPIKILANDGRAMLNLACGTIMHWGWNNLDFSPYALLARKPRLARALKKAGLLSAQRQERLNRIDPAIIRWDLRKGIPFEQNSFNVVYHSHFLEHIDPQHAPGLLKECYRVLKPGGILRVVVPDLELLAREYLLAVEAVDADRPAATKLHHQAIANLFDQMVRREATGAREQTASVRWIERKIRGGSADTGELHRWMYDRHSLGQLLTQTGFRTLQRQSASTSMVHGWTEFQLDTNPDGSVCKSESLFMEAVK